MLFVVFSLSYFHEGTEAYTAKAFLFFSHMVQALIDYVIRSDCESSISPVDLTVSIELCFHLLICDLWNTMWCSVKLPKLVYFIAKGRFWNVITNTNSWITLWMHVFFFSSATLYIFMYSNVILYCVSFSCLCHFLIISLCFSSYSLLC